jgi:hypothetical protein
MRHKILKMYSDQITPKYISKVPSLPVNSTDHDHANDYARHP